MNEAAYSVYKALADPSRRQMLDLMREQPRTTGELALHFEADMSRFGVMKHLGVLEKAGLVTVRRRGRQRFNHLNAVPLREIYERWVGQYADQAAASLTNLKRLVERQSSENPSPKSEESNMSVNKNQAGIESFVIAQEIVIDAKREEVWRALTADIGKWWAFRSVHEGKGEMSLEARIGGQFVERCGEDGALWGTVVRITQGELLQLSGALGTSSRPVQSLYGYELVEEGERTRLLLTHQCIGYDLQDFGDKYHHGWETLLGTYLKAYLEDGKTWRDVEAAQA